MRSEFDYDVIIIGCGPVGALAANLMGDRDLRCLVLEESSELHSLPRAVHIDHEMMRLLHSAGLSAAMGPLVREAHGHIHIGADGGVIRYMGTAGRARRFGWANDYFFFQPELDEVLRRRVASMENVSLRLGARVVGLQQDAEGALVSVDEVDGQRTYSASYVVACDGARSTVRKSLCLGLDDFGFEEPWLVVDVQVDGPIHFPAYSRLPEEADLQHLSVMVCDPQRPMTIVPGRGGHRRWEFMLLPGESDADMMRPEVVRDLLAPWVEGASYEIIRATTYRFHGLVAQDWRKGRVFLAGDAAHQTPPFFGQGMCHGFRDVSNLAWKLAMVVDGMADDALLDTYQQERDPQVRGVIGLAINAGRYICQLDPILAAERDAAMRLMASPDGAPDIIPRYERGVVGVGGGERFIQPWVVDPAGRRALLDDAIGGSGRFILLTRGMATGWTPSPKAADVIDAVGLERFAIDAGGGLSDPDAALSDWLGARKAAAVVLRPDAYVYGVAETADDIDALIIQLGDLLKLFSVPTAEEEARLCIA